MRMFACNHKYLDDIIDTCTLNRLGIRDSIPMLTTREKFRRKSVMWFLYNLYFPIVDPRKNDAVSTEGRMKREELMEWEIEALEHDERLQLSADRVLWKRAKVEVFQKIQDAFSPPKVNDFTIVERNKRAILLVKRQSDLKKQKSSLPRPSSSQDFGTVIEGTDQVLVATTPRSGRRATRIISTS